MSKFCDDMYICQGKKVSELSISCKLKIDSGQCERGREEPPFDVAVNRS
ncbi:hypothetical protein ES702_00769 [subsurface metagenome]